MSLRRSSGWRTAALKADISRGTADSQPPRAAGAGAPREPADRDGNEPEERKGAGGAPSGVAGRSRSARGGAAQRDDARAVGALVQHRAEEGRKFAAQVVPFQRQRHGRLKETGLGAAVVPLALKQETVNRPGAGGKLGGDRVGQLDLSAGAGAPLVKVAITSGDRM